MFILHQKTLYCAISTVSFSQISPLALGFPLLTLSKYLFAGQGILGLEQKQFLCYIFSIKQTHAQSSNKNLRNNRHPKENTFEQVIYDVNLSF